MSVAQRLHCLKIVKPSQSLPLQMAERLCRAQLDSVANHITARSISDCALTDVLWRDWLLSLAEFDVNIPPFAVVSLSVATWFLTMWIGGTVSRLYMCKSVVCGLRPIVTNKSWHVTWTAVLIELDVWAVWGCILAWLDLTLAMSKCCEGVNLPCSGP